MKGNCFTEFFCFLSNNKKKEIKNTRVSRRKETLKIRADINAKKKIKRERERDHNKNQQSQKLVL